MKDIDKRKAIEKAMAELYPQLQINCKKLCGKGFDQWGTDLLPHTVDQFLSMDLDRQYEIMFEDKPEHYITRAMAMQLKSSTSTFYNRYRKPMMANRELLPDYEYKDYNTTLDTPVDTEIKECFAYHVENTLDYYDKYLIISHYYTGMTVTEMAKNTGIQPGRLTRDMKKVLTKLKKLCSPD